MLATTAKSTSAMSAQDRSSAFPGGSISSGAPAASSTRRRSGDGLQAVIPGQPAGLNPESRDSGFALRAPRNDDPNSIILHPGQLVGVKVAVAEQFLADSRALHEESDVELVGHRSEESRV